MWYKYKESKDIVTVFVFCLIVYKDKFDLLHLLNFYSAV